MKKGLTAILATLTLACTLVACGGVNQGYADKINSAAATEKKEDDFKYDQIVKDLGSPTTSALIAGTGVAIWVEGCKTASEAKEKADAGKKLKALTITFVGNTAARASFGEYTPDSK